MLPTGINDAKDGFWSLASKHLAYQPLLFNHTTHFHGRRAASGDLVKITPALPRGAYAVRTDPPCVQEPTARV